MTTVDWRTRFAGPARVTDAPTLFGDLADQPIDRAIDVDEISIGTRDRQIGPAGTVDEIAVGIIDVAHLSG